MQIFAPAALDAYMTNILYILMDTQHINILISQRKYIYYIYIYIRQIFRFENMQNKYTRALRAPKE